VTGSEGRVSVNNEQLSPSLGELDSWGVRLGGIDAGIHLLRWVWEDYNLIHTRQANARSSMLFTAKMTLRIPPIVFVPGDAENKEKPSPTLCRGSYPLPKSRLQTNTNFNPVYLAGFRRVGFNLPWSCSDFDVLLSRQGEHLKDVSAVSDPSVTAQLGFNYIFINHGPEGVSCCASDPVHLRPHSAKILVTNHSQPTAPTLDSA